MPPVSFTQAIYRCANANNAGAMLDRLLASFCIPRKRHASFEAVARMLIHHRRSVAAAAGVRTRHDVLELIEVIRDACGLQIVVLTPADVRAGLNRDVDVDTALYVLAMEEGMGFVAMPTTVHGDGRAIALPSSQGNAEMDDEILEAAATDAMVVRAMLNKLADERTKAHGIIVDLTKEIGCAVAQRNALTKEIGCAVAQRKEMTSKLEAALRDARKHEAQATVATKAAISAHKRESDANEFKRAAEAAAATAEIELASAVAERLGVELERDVAVRRLERARLERDVAVLETDIADSRREAAEFFRRLYERKRDDAERKREDAEHQRDDAEIKRDDAELKRKDAESKRTNAEIMRTHAELMRADADAGWADAECAREEAAYHRDQALQACNFAREEAAYYTAFIPDRQYEIRRAHGEKGRR